MIIIKKNQKQNPLCNLPSPSTHHPKLHPLRANRRSETHPTHTSPATLPIHRFPAIEPTYIFNAIDPSSFQCLNPIVRLAPPPL